MFQIFWILEGLGEYTSFLIITFISHFPCMFWELKICVATNPNCKLMSLQGNISEDTTSLMPLVEKLRSIRRLRGMGLDISIMKINDEQISRTTSPFGK